MFGFRNSGGTASKVSRHGQHVAGGLARHGVGTAGRLDVAHKRGSGFQRQALHQIHHLQAQIDLRLKARARKHVGSVVRCRHTLAGRGIHNHRLRDARQSATVFAGFERRFQVTSALSKICEKLSDFGVYKLPHARVLHRHHRTVLRNCRGLHACRPQKGRIDAGSCGGGRSEDATHA